MAVDDACSNGCVTLWFTAKDLGGGGTVLAKRFPIKLLKRKLYGGFFF